MKQCKRKPKQGRRFIPRTEDYNGNVQGQYVCDNCGDTVIGKDGCAKHKCIAALFSKMPKTAKPPLAVFEAWAITGGRQPLRSLGFSRSKRMTTAYCDVFGGKPIRVRVIVEKI